MQTNVLYLAVLPLIHVGMSNYGLTEQTITLFPSREFATEFFPDEVQAYIDAFQNRANKYLSGGHVKDYTCEREDTEDGRVIVKVIQNVI